MQSKKCHGHAPGGYDGAKRDEQVVGDLWVWDVLRFINVLGCGIVSGTYTFEMVVVVPATNAAPTSLSANIHRALFKNLPNRFMPWFGTSGGLAALVLLIAGGHHVSSEAQIFYAIGAPFWIATFIILAGFSRPRDEQISEWAESTIPEDQYWRVRKEWNRLMYLRGPCGVIGFSMFICATLS